MVAAIITHARMRCIHERAHAQQKGAREQVHSVAMSSASGRGAAWSDAEIRTLIGLSASRESLMHPYATKKFIKGLQRTCRIRAMIGNGHNVNQE